MPSNGVNAGNLAVVRKGLRWGTYDFANSAYYFVYVLYLFPVMLSSRSRAEGMNFEMAWGITQAAAVAVAVGLGLTAGAFIDRAGVVRVARVLMIAAPLGSMLIPLALLCQVATPVLLVVFILVHGVYLLSLTVYDASLSWISQDGVERAAVSGWAWGWGYWGGLSCLAVMQIGLHWYPRYSAWDFAAGSVYFLGWSAVAAYFLRTTRQASDRPAVELTTRGHNAGGVVPWKLLCIMMLVVDGLAIYMGYMGIYGTKVVGLSDAEMIRLLGLLQLLAFPMTGIVTSLTRWGVGRVLASCAVVWCVVAALVTARPTTAVLYLATVLVACVVGATQALMRSIFADHVPRLRAARGFSVYAVLEKGAAVIGPLVGGVAISAVGYRPVLLVAGMAVAAGCIGIVLYLNNHGPTPQRQAHEAGS